jgi:enolase
MGEGSKFKVFGTSNPELLIAPVALGVSVARLRALADFFSIPLEEFCFNQVQNFSCRVT